MIFATRLPSLRFPELAPGAMVKLCTPDDEACVPTYSVACSTTWAGDTSRKPMMARLSPTEEAWCAADGRIPKSSDRNTP